MRPVIEDIVDMYETGKINRREFVQTLIMIAMPLQSQSSATHPIFQGKSLNHVTLSVSDLARSREFYQRLLGLSVIYQDSETCNLGLGGSFLSLYNKYDKSNEVNHFCVGIENFNFEEVMNTLKENGINPTVEFGTQVYLRDPDNIKVQLCANNYKG